MYKNLLANISYTTLMFSFTGEAVYPVLLHQFVRPLYKNEQTIKVKAIGS